MTSAAASVPLLLLLLLPATAAWPTAAPAIRGSSCTPPGSLYGPGPTAAAVSRAQISIATASAAGTAARLVYRPLSVEACCRPIAATAARSLYPGAVTYRALEAFGGGMSCQ